MGTSGCGGEPLAFGERIMENKFQFGAAVILMFMSGYAAVNWRGVISNVRNQRRAIDKHYSMAPLISAFVAVSAYIAWIV